MSDTDTATASGINAAPDTLPSGPAVLGSSAAASADAPLTIDQARSRRNEILADKVLTKKLMEGDPGLRAEMHRLNEVIAGQDIGSAIQNSLTGLDAENPFANATTDGILSKSEYAAAARHLGDAFPSPEIFAEFVAGRATVTAAARAEAAQLKQNILSDKEWVAAYRSGSQAHRAQLKRIHAVLTCGIAAPGTETMRVTSPLSEKK